MNMFLMFGIFELKKKKYYHDLYFKCSILLLADAFEKFVNKSLKTMGYVQVIIWAHQV